VAVCWLLGLTACLPDAPTVHTNRVGYAAGRYRLPVRGTYCREFREYQDQERIAALAAEHGLVFGNAPWLEDVIARYDLTPPPGSR
jgi:hypothetical protein